MLTICKLSTISYNTDDYLCSVLNSLLNARKISFWAFINHAPEDEELAKHKHLLLIPDTQLSTTDLSDAFLEFDPEMPQNPLRCIDWRKTSSISDWLLYAIHDSVYCKLKYGENKKFHYEQSDVKCSDKYQIANYWYEAYHEFKFWKSQKFQKFLKNGMTAKQLVKSGYVSMGEMVQFNAMCSILSESNKTDSHKTDGADAPPLFLTDEEMQPLNAE